MVGRVSGSRLTRVLGHLGIASSSWYRQAKPGERRRKPGPRPSSVPPAVGRAVKGTAKRFPWWGYKRIAVICRRDRLKVSDRLVYRVMKAHDLLQKPQPRAAELHQTAKLFELFPPPFPFTGPKETAACIPSLRCQEIAGVVWKFHEAQVPRRRGRWVFPSSMSRTGHHGGIHKYYAEPGRAAGTRFWLHGLRNAFITVSEREITPSRSLMKRLVNHARDDDNTEGYPPACGQPDQPADERGRKSKKGCCDGTQLNQA